MSIKNILPVLLGAVLYMQGPVGFAQDSKFDNPELLLDTLTADDKQEWDDAQAKVTELNDAKIVLEDSLEGATTEEQEQINADIEALNEEIAQAEEEAKSAEDKYNQEKSDTESVIDDLSEDQVSALNQKLNNAVNSGLLVDIDAEDLQAVVDGNYNFQQIGMFTKAYEEEAKFNNLADKFEEKGMEKQATMMEERAQTQKDRFEGKIEKFEGKGEAKAAAKDAAKQEAKGVAKQAAKEAAKDTAKGQAKEDAKDNAKNTAKDVIKEEGKDAAKGKDNKPTEG